MFMILFSLKIKSVYTYYSKHTENIFLHILATNRCVNMNNFRFVEPVVSVVLVLKGVVLGYQTSGQRMPSVISTPVWCRLQWLGVWLWHMSNIRSSLYRRYISCGLASVLQYSQRGTFIWTPVTAIYLSVFAGNDHRDWCFFVDISGGHRCSIAHSSEHRATRCTNTADRDGRTRWSLVVINKCLHLVCWHLLTELLFSGCRRPTT